MSGPWGTLLPVAMVGSERQTFTAPALSGAVGELLQRAAASVDDPTRALLQAAGVLAVCERAGLRGTLQSDESTLPPPAAAETRPALTTPDLVERLIRALDDTPRRLQIELLQRLNRAGLCLPATLLPLVLDAGRRDSRLRPSLEAVLGERGRWLAVRNPDWRYASGASDQVPEERLWAEGNLAQRLELLRRQRARDPDAARERLNHSLPELPARERTELLAALATGLSPADEALLTDLLKDRSRDVRRAAAGLLVCLPDSAHAQRAGARMAACLTRTDPARWQVSAPETAGEDWKADGIELDRPRHESLGERAWWLYQLVRRTPLSWWTTQLQADPPALLRRAVRSEWAEALVRGWHDVLQHDPRVDWCLAFVAHWPGKLLQHGVDSVLGLLPPEYRVPLWIDRLQREPKMKPQAYMALLEEIFQASPEHEPLPPELSTALLEPLTRLAARKALHQHQGLRAWLPELAAALHPAALERFDTLPRHEDEPSNLTETLHRCAQITDCRRAFGRILHHRDQEPAP